MAGIKMEVTFRMGGLATLIKSWDSYRVTFLHDIAKQGRLTLKGQLLSGQEIYLKKDKNKKGYDNIRSRVGRGGNSAYITSAPTNLFERGRTLRSGAKEPGKYIITRKLRALVDANMDNYVMQFERKLEREGNK